MSNAEISLLTDVDNYKVSLQMYKRYNQQFDPQRDWMRTKFAARISDILDAKKDIKILAVGAGSGEVDIDFLNEIVRCGRERLGEGYSVLYHVIEPNSANVDFFRNAVSKNPDYSKIEFKWFTGFFEDFCDEFKERETEENKFDFVHFVGCFYHFDSPISFDRTYDHLLANKGIMCGMGENKNAFWPKMMQFLADHEMEHVCFTCSGTVSQNYFLPGWEQHAKHREWKHESYIQAYYLEVTPMYDSSSTDGNHLLDFIMHRKCVRESVKQSVIDDFFKLLDASKVEKEVLEDGKKVKKIYFPAELGVIMITKE